MIDHWRAGRPSQRAVQVRCTPGQWQQAWTGRIRQRCSSTAKQHNKAAVPPAGSSPATKIRLATSSSAFADACCPWILPLRSALSTAAAGARAVAEGAGAVSGDRRHHNQQRTATRPNQQVPFPHPLPLHPLARHLPPPRSCPTHPAGEAGGAAEAAARGGFKRASRSKPRASLLPRPFQFCGQIPPTPLPGHSTHPSPPTHPPTHLERAQPKVEQQRRAHPLADHLGRLHHRGHPLHRVADAHADDLHRGGRVTKHVAIRSRVQSFLMPTLMTCTAGEE